VRIRRIEHVGIAVKDLEQSRVVWEQLLGVPLAEVEELAQYRARIGMYPIGDSKVELLQGTTPDAKFSVVVRERGEGLHHLCLEVDDIDGALAELKAKGVKLLDEHARPGHKGMRIAFIDPASTGNVLIELVERAHP
jgi:methylmalonyl-CoA/ethylmalonyl-CoA epimerase